MWQRTLPHSVTPNVSATLVDDVDTPLAEEEVDEPLWRLARTTMSRT